MENERPEGHDTVLQRILNWSQTRPKWQRDALRRIVADGYPDDLGIQAILAQCKKEHGDQSVTDDAVPLAQEHLPVDPGSGESISLRAISDVIGVNQLAPSQTLPFEVDGLTIVYGQNGTGKSGYTRILKQACQSRHAGDIMPDVYNPPPAGKATAQIAIVRANGSSESITWTNGGSLPEALSAVTVFDRAAGSVHVQKKNEVWFRPFGLDVPDDLAGVCQELKIRLTAEKSTIERQQNAVFSNPTWSDRSELGKAMSALTYETDVSSITPKEPFTEADEARLLQLTADLSQNPSVAAQRQRDYAAQLDQLSTYLQKIAEALSESAVAALLDKKAAANVARAAATTAAKDAFSGLALEGIGETTWRALWDSARSYSQSASPGGIRFPPATGETCVLCHQPIDEQTARRMLDFDEFIKKDTETKAAAAELVLDEARNKLEGFGIHLRHVSAVWRALKSAKPELGKQVSRFIASGKLRQRTLLDAMRTAEAPGITQITASPIDAIKTAAADTRAYAATLDEAVDSAARAVIEDELADLRDQKQAEALLEIAAIEIARLGELHRIEQCLKETSTTAITKLGNDIADDVITPRMQDRFQLEIVELAGSRVRVKVVRSGGKFGSPQYEVQLFADRNAKVHDVLSEGEQTCVALASYLTELANASHASGLVFDDPVSSLDHRWRFNVAKRLVKEAGARQVIVFTHDMVFVNDLHQLASEKNMPCNVLHLTRGADVVGLVNEQLPWAAAGVRQRIDELEKAARAAKKLYDAHDDDGYKKAVNALYSDLRATWERALEDVVFAGVIVRHRDYINTKDLNKVTALEPSDIQQFQRSFKKCCDFTDAHDPSRGRDIEPPEPGIVLQDVQDLRSWSEALRTKMNAAARA